MDPVALSHALQVDALLKGRALERVKSVYGSIHPAAYAEVFTITRPEIFEYLRQTYRLDQLIRMEPGKSGGFYAIPLSQGFHVYEQYETGTRAMTRDLGSVSSEVKVLALFVDYLITTSGTGLKLE